MADPMSCADHGCDCGCYDYQQAKGALRAAVARIEDLQAEVYELRERLRRAEAIDHTADTPTPESPPNKG